MTPRNARLPDQKRGDTWAFTFTWSDDAGAPIDLTACTARMQVRDKSTKSLCAEPDHIVIDSLAGSVGVEFHPDTTAVVVPGIYYTDLEMTFPDGTVISTATMEMDVLEDITLPAVT